MGRFSGCREDPSRIILELSELAHRPYHKRVDRLRSREVVGSSFATEKTRKRPNLSDIYDEILALKEREDATILAHYYQEGEIQDFADVTGDSLKLARAATQVNTGTIVFCGVHFMAETAKMLNHDKRVLLPDLRAGCSLADSCPAPAHPNPIETNTNSGLLNPDRSTERPSITVFRSHGSPNRTVCPGTSCESQPPSCARYASIMSTFGPDRLMIVSRFSELDISSSCSETNHWRKLVAM